MVVGVGAFSGSTHVGISGATLNADTFAAMATGTIQDFITIPPIPLVGGSGGTLHIPLHLTGALSVNSEVSAGAPPPTLFAQFSFEWTVDGLPVGHDGISLSAAGMLNAMPVDRTFVITVPFNFGVEVAFGSRYIIAANFVLSSAQACPMQSCDFAIAQGVIDSDFAHTGTFERATVLDNDGNPVPGATIISASGFDYLNPAGPGPAAVPEPSTLALICSAGIAVGVWRVVRWSGAANKWRQASNCET